TSYGAIREVLTQQGIGEPSPAQVAAAVIAIRRAKLPDWTTVGNAGSFFKNPLVEADQFAQLQGEFPGLPAYPQADGRVKLAAGWLIDQCGWKGRRQGAVGTYPQQALVIVNYGGATGSDILDFSQAVQASVAERFGVHLEREVNTAGEKHNIAT
ncbi:MAG: UDP-N-acetylenolpyruvoylglucosamine reductase, partial [Rhodocyclaceae bacterium]|nr:UDP-N-acetylenolpyruvoylglucosamine reductase [Rhodocyclaceae bacterium]